MLFRSGKIARFTTQYQIDSESPSIDHLAPDLSTSLNGLVRFRSFVSDNNRIAEILLKLGSNGDWLDYSATEFLVDTSLYTNASAGLEIAPGVWEVPFEVKALDSAGNSTTTSYSMKIDQSSDAPIISLINLDSTADTLAKGLTNNFFELGPVVKGSVEDDDGIALTGVTYSLDGATAVSVNSLQGPTRYRSYSIDLQGLSDGFYNLNIFATDDATLKEGAATETVSLGPVHFVIDQAAPVVSESLGSNSVVNRNTAFGLSGTAVDTHGIASLQITQKKDEGSALAITVDPPVTSDDWATWSISNLPRDPDSVGLETSVLIDGLYEYVITATDLVGRTHSVTRTIRFDATGPNITVTAPAADSWANSASVTVRGIASDTTGINAIYYHEAADESALEIALPADLSSDATWAAAGWNKASGTSSWELALTGLPEGLSKVWIRSVDTVLNVSAPQSLSFGVDLNNPEHVSVTTPPAFTNTGFGLIGEASDTNALSGTAIVVTQKKGSGSAVTIDMDGPATTDNWSNWTLDLLPRILKPWVSFTSL